MDEEEIKPCIQNRLQGLVIQKHINSLIVIIVLISLILSGFYLFSYVGFGNNLLSEIFGIIVTYYIIGWLLEKREVKKHSPYKKALLNHIQHHCYIILLCILEEDLLLITGDRLDQYEQIEKSRNELEEYYYVGKDIISTEKAALLYDIILSIRGCLYFSNLGQLSLSKKVGLSLARKIKTLFQILESPDYFLRAADGAIERVIIDIENEKTLGSM